MNSPVEQIKERLSIEEVVSAYIKLEQSGINFKAKCPFHNEKTASFFVSPGRNSYYCFGCNRSGDIFTFVEEFEGLDFKGALKLLAEKAGVTLGSYGSKDESEKDKLYRILEDAAKFFEASLSKENQVEEYIKGRGIEEKTIRDFRIGFAPRDWSSLFNYLKTKGWGQKEIELAGLAKQSEKGVYDRFRSRIMFPISDSSGRIIAFSGRIYEAGLSKETIEKSAKYLNSPDTPVFNKSAVLYGLSRAKEAIRKNNFSILVEGQMDLVLSHQAGFRNTVATSGTALSDSTVSKENVVSNLGLVRRLSENIVLAFDADRAGFKAAERAGKIALSLGMDVKVAGMPENFDPADLISKKGVDAWREAIRRSEHIIEFFLHKILDGKDIDQRKALREVKDRILPYVHSLESSIEKVHFIKKISDVSGIPEEALKEDLKKVEQELKYEKEELDEAKETSKQLFRKDHIERRLLGIILWQKENKNPGIDLESILAETKDLLGDINDIEQKTKNNKEDLIFEAEVFYGQGGNIKKDMAELLGNLREEYLKEELGKKMRELHLAEESKDKNKSAQILKECQIISNKIQDLKNNRSK
jgi:DNA primase